MSNATGSSTLPTSADHARARHAAQQRKRANRKSGGSTRLTTNLFADIKQDKIDARRTRELNAMALEHRRERQAEIAGDLLPESLNGLALEVANSILLDFPDIKFRKGTNRFDACVARTIKNLSDKDKGRKVAVQMGVDHVRTALSRAEYLVPTVQLT